MEVTPMTDVTQVALAIEQVDPSAPEQLLPLVYDAWRRLAGGCSSSQPNAVQTVSREKRNEDVVRSAERASLLLRGDGRRCRPRAVQAPWEDACLGRSGLRRR
jgi:hypothetical protein